MGFSGLGEERANREFFTIKRDFLSQSAPKTTSDEEYDQRIADGYKRYDYVNGDGEKKYTLEKRYPNIIGQIVKIFERKGNFDIEQCIVLKDQNGDEAQIAVPKYMNSQVENLMNRMCNDAYSPEMVVKLVPYRVAKGGGKKGYNEGVVIYLLDDKDRFTVKVEKAFTVEGFKNGDHDMPPWESSKGTGKNKGKLVWNNDASVDYLQAKLDAKFENVGEADWSFMTPAEEIQATPAEAETEDEMPI